MRWSVLLLTACQFGLASNRGGGHDDRPPLESGPAYNQCGAPDGERATGTVDDPVAMPGLPFVDALGDTSTAASSIDTYDCGPMDRSGPEVVYTLTLDDTADLRVELAAAQGTAVTAQLLGPDATVTDGAATGCVAVDTDGLLSADRLAAGTYTLVVDTLVTQSGTSRPGAYTLAVTTEKRGDWDDVELADGLRWKHKRDVREGVANQDWNVLVVEMATREVRALPNLGCTTVAEKGEADGAVAGINGGFGDAECHSYDLVRDDGVTYSKNTYDTTQRLVAWNDGTPATTEWLDQGLDYTAHDNAFGSFPSIVTAGQKILEPAGTDNLYTVRQARTAVGLDENGDLLLFVADGGTASADGLTLDELADAMLELGAVHAVNLEGEGSTTMWVSGCSVNGVVNHPLDGGGTSREGARGVADGVYVF